VFALIGLLAGCGAEVASTGVAEATLQATQAEQGRARAAQLAKELDAAARRAREASSAAEQ